MKMTEIKIIGMEESTTKGEIVEAIIGISGCSFIEVKVNGIRTNRNGMATAWVKCPIAVANKIIEEDGIKIGWVKARTVLLRARPLQCYRCMRFGHVKQYCREKEEIKDRCYKCGMAGHKVAKCNARIPKCFVCEEKGKRSDHRMGGPLCGEAKAKGWRQSMRGERTINSERKRDTEEEKDMEVTMEGEEEEVVKPKRMRLREDQTQESEEEIRIREKKEIRRDMKKRKIILNLLHAMGRRTPCISHRIKMCSIWQLNLNHARRAQDLLVHEMLEKGVDLAIISEPYNGKNIYPRWHKDKAGKAAIVWSEKEDGNVKRMGEGNGWATIKWKQWRCISVYLSPKLSRAEFEERLEDIEKEIRKGKRDRTLVAGDFNAKGKLWGSRKDCSKGRVLSKWAAALDLRIINKGREYTCKTSKGTSIVDLTWGLGRASEDIKEWKVVGCETLSDHELIQYTLGREGGTKNKEDRKDNHGHIDRRWAIKKIDRGKLLETIVGNTWAQKREGKNAETGEGNEEKEINREENEIKKIMIDACDAAMPRIKGKRRKQGVAWWSDRLGELRAEVNKLRRHIKRRNRMRKRKTKREEIEQEIEIMNYRLSRGLYANEIGRAKAQGWKELLNTLESDPWGQPYRIVRQKSKSKDSGPVMEKMDPKLLTEVVNTLFPLEEGNENKDGKEDKKTDKDGDKKVGEITRSSKEDNRM